MILNFIIVFLIIFSGVAYFYFKTRQFRTSLRFPIQKKMYASMAGASLGALLLFFGINQFIIFDGMITYIIAAIFIVLGLISFTHHYRAHKHYKQFVNEEMILNEN